LFNAFFVGAEFALISARRTLIEPRVAAGSRSARITLGAMENVSLMMAGAQLGITVCSLALGAVSEPAIAHLLEIPLAAAGIPAILLHPIAFVVALSVVTFLHVVVGEMVPKNIALAGPERSALVLAPPLVLCVRVLLPPIRTMNQVANLVLHMVRVEPKQEVTSSFTRDEVADLVAQSRQGGLLGENDERLLLGALSFEERDTSGVALPMGTVQTLPAGATHADGEAAAATGFSRFPVTRADGSAGFVHLKDVIAELVGQIRDDSRRHEPQP